MPRLRVQPERNLRESDPTSNRNNLSGTEDRAPALACPLLQGRILDWIPPGSPPGTKPTQWLILPPHTNSQFPTKLGRRIVGWYVMRMQPGGTYPTETVDSPPDVAPPHQTFNAFLSLYNPGPLPTTIKVWVF